MLFNLADRPPDGFSGRLESNEMAEQKCLEIDELSQLFHI